MTGQPHLRSWQARTGPELAELARGDAVAVLPLAAVEQHGPHLPLSTDLDIGEGLLAAALERVPADFPALVLPAMAVGTSGEHTAYPGTLSLEPETAIAVITELGESVARTGIRRLVLFNSHGGNRQVADLAALRLRRAHDMVVVKASYFRFPPPPPPGLADAERRHGLHGGFLETALMLALRPEAVRTEALARFPSVGETMAEAGPVEPEGSASFAWMAQDLNPAGVVGDAGAATADIGRRFVDHYATVLARVLEQTRGLPLERLGGKPGAS